MVGRMPDILGSLAVLAVGLAVLGLPLALAWRGGRSGDREGPVELVGDDEGEGEPEDRL